MKQLLNIQVILFILLICSCKSQQDQGGIAPGDAAVEMVGQTEVSNDRSAALPIRKVIKQGDITFETDNAKLTREMISKHLTEYKGYVASDNVYVQDDRVEHRITVKVPSNKFEALVDKIAESARKLDSKNINAQDVTEEFIDNESRIKTKKELENRYKELLKKANNVQEILAIEKEIGTLRTEIEALEGRLKYLNDNVDFSSLSIIFYERSATSNGFGWKVGQALNDGWTYTIGFVIGLISLWPFILIGFVILYLIMRSRRNRKNYRKPVNSQKD